MSLARLNAAAANVTVPFSTWKASPPVPLHATDPAYAFNVSPNIAVTAPTVYGLRKFLYPYRAMLAISSDADHETLRKFILIHEFINTTAMTPMGKGLGLDFGDSMFLYNGSNLPGAIDFGKTPISGELTFFKGASPKPNDAAFLNGAIHGGWIDTLHSFGDYSMVNPHRTEFQLWQAVRAIGTLEANQDWLPVWTDHGNQSNVDDFGAYGHARMFWYQQGANPWSSNDIANLLLQYGVHFIWADLPSTQFGMNSMIYPKRLPDGETMWGFWRYTNATFTKEFDPNWNWTSDDLDQQLSIQHLLQLENLHQYSIIAQHLEANNAKLPLAKSSIQALQLLAREYHRGHILVSSTSRLLQYNVTQQYLRYTVTEENGITIIHLLPIADPVFGTHLPTHDEIRGVTFYTSNPYRTRIEIGITPIPASLIQINPTDGTAPSISVRWFPADTMNYAATLGHSLSR